MAETET